MPRVKDYSQLSPAYAQRIRSAVLRGLSPSVGAGKPRLGETPIRVMERLKRESEGQKLGEVNWLAKEKLEKALRSQERVNQLRNIEIDRKIREVRGLKPLPIDKAKESSFRIQAKEDAKLFTLHRKEEDLRERMKEATRNKDKEEYWRLRKERDRIYIQIRRIEEGIESDDWGDSAEA